MGNMAQAGKVTTITFITEESLFLAAGALWAMRPEEAARDLRSAANQIQVVAGRGMDTESFIPPFMSCNFWGCDDDNNNDSQNVANMISDAIPIPSSNSNNDDIQLGPVSIPNPVGGSFM